VVKPKKIKFMSEKEYSLHEAIADIAYLSGVKGYYSGNSRQDIADFILWAIEFETIHKDVEWGVDDNPDYIDAIEGFVNTKIADSSPTHE